MYDSAERRAVGAMSQRQDVSVLVMHAHTLGAIACIRSLGRAGYHVVASSPRPNALGFRSNYSDASLVHPPYSERAAFRAWLDKTIDQQRITAIVPTEELLLCLLPELERYRERLPCSTDADTVRTSFSKYLLFERFKNAWGEGSSALQRHLPETWLVNHQTARAALTELPSAERLYLKTDAVLSDVGQPSHVRELGSATIDQTQIDALLRQYSAFIVQRHVSGVGVGVCFLHWQGRMLASFMHRRLHEVPHTGGVSSLREVWWHDAIYADALLRLRHVGWQGIAMLEYRWDPRSDVFHFLEMNGRYWGSMHLPLFAGVDFPRLWIDAFIGLPVTPIEPCKTRLACRDTFPGEVRHLASRFRDRRLSVRDRFASAVEFAALSMNPFVKADLWFPGDRQLYLRALFHYAATAIRVRVG